MVEGTATELAFDYPNGRKFKLSELTWDFKNVVMAGVHGSVGIGRRFRLDLGVRSALTAGSGMMVDRDWDYPDSVSASLEPNDSNWTDESRHPDTSLDQGTILDLNLSVLALQTGPFSLRGIVGYKNDTWKWSARGGTYIYSTEYYGSRDATGSFPAGVEVISYEQRYSIPYFGVGAELDEAGLSGGDPSAVQPGGLRQRFGLPRSARRALRGGFLRGDVRRARAERGLGVRAALVGHARRGVPVHPGDHRGRHGLRRGGQRVFRGRRRPRA